MSQFPLAALSTFTTLSFPAGINNLATAEVVLGTTVLNNDDSLTARWREITVSVALTSYTPVAPAMVEGALIPASDGTNYASIATDFPLGSEAVPTSWCSIDAGTGTKKAYLVFRRLQPVKYKLLLRNSTGVAWPAAGTVVTWAGTLVETR